MSDRPLKLVIVGDGPRDGFTLPPLIGTILGRPVEPLFRDWHYVGFGDGVRLQGLKSARRKLGFLLAAVVTDGHDGLVVVTDRDTDGRRDKLRELQGWRDRVRTDPDFFSVPIGLGEANRHVEAWLLDDWQAMQQVCGLPADAAIPGADCREPKAELDALIYGAGFTLESGLAAVAIAVAPDRCRRPQTTGLKQFADDLRSEFARLLAGNG